ncbi:MAG: DUF4079 family protein [Erysipelotrichia bacterium]|nr:DUF4079 family protein [Erysipelotrichia bacterium]
MKFIHPLFMLFLLATLFKIHHFGKQTLMINPKSPEASQRDTLRQQHRKFGMIVTGLMFLGLLGGIIGVVQFMKIDAIFLKTYGHGFAGAIVLGLMLANIFVGNSIKTLVKDKSRANLLKFHFSLFYTTLICSAYSLISGLVVLFKGPMN